MWKIILSSVVPLVVNGGTIYRDPNAIAAQRAVLFFHMPEDVGW